VELGAAAAIVTGGHGDAAVDHLFDGERHVEIPVDRHDVAATHGAGCTHSATVAALLARGLRLEDAARGAARAASSAVERGLVEIGAGEGPVSVL
jgi:hydroxymethylpyrimidine/phosphomethylpyrimidine kinase